MTTIQYFPCLRNYIKGYNIPKKKYTEYTFKFIGWDYDYIDRINSNMSKYINYLK